MTTIEQLVGEFIDAWNAGRRPDVDAFLERAAPEDRDELASQLETWLELAPTPDYDEPTRQSIASEPALLAALTPPPRCARRSPSDCRRCASARAWRSAMSPAGLTQLFELDDEQRAAAYLEQIERDELDERRLSRRLLDALAADPRRRRRPARARPRRRWRGGQAFFRAEEDADVWIAEDIDVALARCALARAGRPDGRAGPPVPRRARRLNLRSRSTPPRSPSTPGSQPVDSAAEAVDARPPATAAKAEPRSDADSHGRPSGSIAAMPSAAGSGVQPIPHRLVVPVADRGRELLVAAGQPEGVQPVQGRDRRDAVRGRDPHDVVQPGLDPVDHRADPGRRGQQLGGESVGLHLARVGRLAPERRERLHRDRAVMPAAQVTELVGEREALTHRRVRAVDPQHDALAVAPAAAGDSRRQRRDHDRHAQARTRPASARTRAAPRDRARAPRESGGRAWRRRWCPCSPSLLPTGPSDASQGFAHGVAPSQRRGRPSRPAPRLNHE